MSEDRKETFSGAPGAGEVASVGNAGGTPAPQGAGDAVAPLSPPVAVPPRRRHTWRTLFFGLLIFVCGGVVGAGGTLLVVHRMMERVMGQGPELSAERATQRIKRGLGLTDAQARQVQEIYQRRFGTVRNDLQETRLRVGAEVAEMREEIAKILTKEQAAEWRKRADFLERSLPGRGPGGANGRGGPNGPGGPGGLNGPGGPGGTNGLGGPGGRGGAGGVRVPNESSGPGALNGAGGPNGPGGGIGRLGGLGQRPGMAPGVRSGMGGPNGSGVGGPGQRFGMGPGGRLGPGGPNPNASASPSPSPSPSPSVSPSPSPADRQAP
jgi:hypothetical protein